MISLKEYLQLIEERIIPPENPEGLEPGGSLMSIKILDRFAEFMSARDFCIKRNLWTVLSQAWTAGLAAWIGRRRVLEIMSGTGWLARGLADEGVDIIATDDFSWGAHDGGEFDFSHPLFPLLKKTAVEAVKEFADREVLLCSWPPYSKDKFFEACKLWRGKPLIYIGEGNGGCTASDRFFKIFKTTAGPEEAPGIDFVSWPGIHDSIFIGKIK